MSDLEQSLNRPPTLLVGRCFVKRDDGKLLIVRRALDDNHNAGKWEVPGGKVERGQGLADAQKREIWEETGLRVRVIRDFVCAYSYPIEGGRRYQAKFGIAQVVEDGKEVRLSHEHADHKWVSFEQMLDYDLADEVRSTARIAKRFLVRARL